jgi:AraC-like DNA-binding protein
MPWTHELVDSPFGGLVESVSFENGAVGRVRMTPITAVKTKRDIANSADECIHGNLILSGELKVDQGDRTNIARPGDLVLYRSFSPVTLTIKSNEFFDNLAFIIPNSSFSSLKDPGDKFYNRLLTKAMIMNPLASCLGLLTDNLHSFSHDELSALFSACIAPLPLSSGLLGSTVKKPEIQKMNYMLRELLNFINKNISNPDLSPRLTAKELGVSTRYIHKLLAHCGTTFSAYLTAERLEHIKSELIALSGQHIPVSLLAFEWGFNDLSTFNRAFKDRFGCTPSDFRAHVSY